MDFIEELEKEKKENIPFNKHAAEKFISICLSNLGGDPSDSKAICKAQNFYEEQSNLFSNFVKESDSLKKCSGFSLYNAFILIAINGVSLEKNFTTQCYLEARNTKIGKDEKGNDIWEKRAALKISGYGELMMRRRSGQIREINNPVIVYDCDSFAYGEKDGKVFVNYTKTFPRKEGAKIIAGYVKITRPDNSIDYKVMDLEDVKRLMSYSEKNNKKWDSHARIYVNGDANPLYGKDKDGSGIDSGFFAAKLIKHAFKAFPQLKIGDGAVMQSDDDETPVEEVKESPVPFGEEIKVEGTKVEDEDGPF